MNTPKKIPQRMCVVCRKMFPKTELVRIVNGENGVTVDTTGKMSGRGLYICKSAECLAKALKSKSFAKQHGFGLETVADRLEELIER